MRLAVIGGSGMLGAAVVQRAVEGGHEVVSFDRVPTRTPAVESHVLDVRDAGALRFALGRFDGVINTASIIDLHLGRPRSMYAVNVAGVQNVIAACHANDIGRLVHMSSAEAITGSRPLRGATEAQATYPERQLTYYGETKRQGEQLVLQGATESLGTCAVRSYGLFGPGDNTVLPMYLKRMPKRGARYIGDLSARTDVVYSANAAHALVLAAEQLDAGAAWSGSALHLTDSDPINMQVFLSKLVSILGYRISPGRVPRRPVEMLASALELRYRLTKAERWAHPPLTRHSLRLVLDDYWLDGSKLRDVLGYEPAVSRAAAIAETQVWLRDRFGSARTRR